MVEFVPDIFGARAMVSPEFLEKDHAWKDGLRRLEMAVYSAQFWFATSMIKE